MLLGVSTYNNWVDGVLWYILIVSTVIFAGLIAFTVYCLVKFDKKKHPEAVDIKGHFGLEVTWTVIPTIIVISFFYLGWEGFARMRSVPTDAMEVKVTGKKWSWSFKYDNGKTSNELIVPVGKPVKLLMNSEDVVHSFHIPAFRIKEDVVPGLETYLWFVAEEAGTYDVLCAEYCGTQHSYMLAEIKALPEDEYRTWYNKQLTPLELGKVTYGKCLACHTIDGKPTIGPSFKGLWGRTSKVITDGKEREVVVDEDYFRKSLKDPDADKVKGFTAPMSPQNLDENEIKGLIEYLKTLK